MKINSNSYALDKEANILYYFVLAPQPASAPYILRSYDLNTDSSKILNNNFMGGSTISFDQKNKLILIGGFDYDSHSSVVNIYTAEGELKSQLKVPYTVAEIIVKQ